MHHSLEFPDYKAVCSTKEIAMDIINKAVSSKCIKCKGNCISYVMPSSEKIHMDQPYEIQQIIQKYMGFNYILSPIKMDCYYSMGFMSQVIGIADLCHYCHQKVLIPVELFNKIPAKIKCSEEGHYL